MKRIGISLLALLLIGAVATGFAFSPAETPADLNPTPVVEVVAAAPLTSLRFDGNSHDFGKLKMGETGKHTFSVTNTGQHDLVLEKVKPSCGCTLTDYTKEPIAPGKTGYVKVEFPAKKAGVFRKSISVTANVEPQTMVLNIKGEVVN